MHLFGTMGFISLFLGIIINLYELTLKIMGEDIWGKLNVVAGNDSCTGGIQLITIGILAEISMRTYYESGSKTYQVRKVWAKNKGTNAIITAKVNRQPNQIMPLKETLKSAAKLLIKIAVTVVCLWYVSRKIDWGKSLSIIQNSNWLWLVAATGFIL